MSKAEEKALLRYSRRKAKYFGVDSVHLLIEAPQHKPLEQSISNKETIENPLNPPTIEDYIGQDTAKDILRIIVASATIKKSDLPNILISGPFGTGKTTLAKLVMKHYGQKYVFTDGSSINSAFEMEGYYVIDEIHNLSNITADYLNTLIDSNDIHIIGCTTNPGSLPAPFRSRFRTIYLEDYSDKDIFNILMKASDRSSIPYHKEAISIISKRSKQNPRNALSLLQFSEELRTVSQESILSKKTIETALSKLGIDRDGLSKMDRRYLSLLSNNPIGVQQIALTLGVSTQTIENEVEPYLLQTNRISRTPRGRILLNSSKDSLESLLKESIVRQRRVGIRVKSDN